MKVRAGARFLRCAAIRIALPFVLSLILPFVALPARLLAQVTPAAGASDDKALDAARALMGKALFLRGFYLNNNLDYDAAGKVEKSPKTGDWTLAAINVLKVERKGPGEIDLEGVRVAIRYNADSHEFQRHPLNDEKMRVTVKDTGEGKQLEAAFAAMFSVGIDPELQRAMPDYWRHYFDPALAWPQDALSGQTICAGRPGSPPLRRGPRRTGPCAGCCLAGRAGSGARSRPSPA